MGYRLLGLVVAAVVAFACATNPVTGRRELILMSEAQETAIGVQAGDSWQSIAETAGGIVRPATLAVMNGGTVGSQPQVGTRIKIVVEG